MTRQRASPQQGPQGHLGVTNAFLVDTHHPLAITYNDKSVLENMHAATTFSVMARPGHDIFTAFAPDVKKRVRYGMFYAVLM